MELNFEKELDRLNPYQREAVLDESPACVVNANVGSGKTTVLIAKIQYLHHIKGVGYEDMTVLTFTNKAADDLVNPDLVVPDSVTKGEIIQNVSTEAEEVYNQNWTEFKAACD